MHTKGGGGQESEESRVIYTLAPDAKYIKLFCKKDMEALIGQSLIIHVFSFIYNTRYMHTVYLNFYKYTMHKTSKSIDYLKYNTYFI